MNRNKKANSYIQQHIVPRKDSVELYRGIRPQQDYLKTEQPTMTPIQANYAFIPPGIINEDQIIGYKLQK